MWAKSRTRTGSLVQVGRIGIDKVAVSGGDRIEVEGSVRCHVVGSLRVHGTRRLIDGWT